MKKISFLLVFMFGASLVTYSQCDSLTRFTEKEVLKLSNQIYELRKSPCLEGANAQFPLKDTNSVKDKRTWVDFTGKACNDTVYSYTDADVLKLSQYIYELEKQDSICKAKKAAEELAAAEAAKPPVKEFKLEEEKEIKDFAKQIFFEVDKATLTPSSYKPLDDILKILTQYINLNFVIEGHTDSDASDEYNMSLSKRRAKTVKDYFISKGIPAARITSVAGFGESKPIAPNDTEEGKALNRRVEIKAVH